jgi:RNA polymerase primary sigma factor
MPTIDRLRTRSAKILSREEEYETAVQARAGDSAAIERLVRSNLRFVALVAFKYEKNGVPLADLIAAGNAALFHSVKSFNPERGIRFLSYSIHSVRQAMRAVIQKEAYPYDVPAELSFLAARIREAEWNFQARFGRSPDEDELINETNSNLKDIKIARGLSKKHIPFDLPLRGSDELTFADTYVALDQVHTDRRAVLISEYVALMRALESFSSKNQQIIELSFGLHGKTVRPIADIARITGLSEGRVVKLRAAILEKMKALMQNEPDPAAGAVDPGAPAGPV